MAGSMLSIEKLDATNYASWKIQMRSILIFQELWQYVSGQKLEPEDEDEDEDEDEAAKWMSQDEKALSLIFLSMKSTELIHVKNCKTSREAWIRLCEIFQPSGPSSKISLFKKLLMCKMTGTMSMSDYLKEFYSISERLREIQVDIPEDLLAIILLCSLPDRFDNFVVAMESRDEMPSLSVLKAKLFQEDSRKLEKESENCDNHVLAAQSKRNFKSSKGKKGVKCFSCGKIGHFASKCPEKQDERHKQKSASSFGLFNVKESRIVNFGEWCLDSGATSHMCSEKSMFSELKQDFTQKIYFADEKFLMASGIGNVHLELETGSIDLLNVIYVPELKGNFISVTKITRNHHTCEFVGTNALIKNSKGNVVMKAIQVGDVYVVKPKNFVSAMKSTQDSLTKWHSRFGHLNISSLKEMYFHNMVMGIDKISASNDFECIICAKGKITTKPFPKQATTRSVNILDVIHSDICGPMQVTSSGGARYFVTFIDDKSRMVFVYFMRTRDEIFDIFRKFKQMVECQTSKKIKVLRSDNGSEYLSAKFSSFLEVHGIQRQLTVQYSPQQNGVAERANRTLVEMARCLLLNSKLPEYLWGEAINTATYLRNRSISKSLQGVTPFESWYGRKPNVSHLRVFGSKAVVLNKRPGKSKFQAKGVEMIMVGYSEESKAYRLFNSKTRKVVKDRNVVFYEDANVSVEDKTEDDFIIFNFEEKSCAAEPNSRISQASESENIPDVPQESRNPESNPRIGPGRPKLIRTGRPGRPRKEYNVIEILSSIQEEIPTNVAEAFKSQNVDEWKSAMKKEYDALVSNGTWDLVDLPKNCKAIGNRWIFNIRKKPDGTIERYKCRLVAKGCSQKYQVDYFETFSPVIRYSSIRLILALAVEYKLLLHHVDVTNAYLHGVLEEEVYMKQPEGFEDAKDPNKVCKLKKSIYGLKQSGREWNKRLNVVLLRIGFQRCVSDNCIYVKTKEDEINIIGVYVDDIILACSSNKSMESIKGQIDSEFDTVDKGPLKYYLGIEIEREGDRGSISISQEKYIKDFLKDLDMETTRKCYTPLDPGMKLKKSTAVSTEKVDPTLYQSLIGTLMYLSTATRPDITHSVSKLAQFNSNPNRDHLSALKHLIRYISTTLSYKLNFKKTSENLIAYVDADWANNTDDRKSYTGFTFILAGGAITWQSKKQTSIALSSTEAEYIAISQCSREALYLRSLMSELGFDELIQDSTTIFNDNLGAQQLVKNPIHHPRTKHIDIAYHFVRGLFEDGIIDIQYKNTEDMTADILTKNLGKTKHLKFESMLGITFV